MSRLVRYRADEIEAGDTIVIKEGNIRKFYHVCEVRIDRDRVDIVYNVRNGFDKKSYEPDDAVRIRI